MKVLVAAAVGVLVVPAAAQAEATLVARDVPLRGGRVLAAATPSRFDLVGLHWRGTGSVSFRTRAPGGAWSGWRAAAPESEDLPDSDSAESVRAAGWRPGNPWWTGSADRIQYRLHGRVTRLRAYFVSSPEERIPRRTLSIAGSPAIVPRLSWNASERIRRAPPVYAPSLRLALVHHTAGSNSYSRAQSASIVRAIELYHVLGNGWNDIGYNFLVDKYGQVFEGRYGGVTRNVVGAHAQGFNYGSVGVALLGNYDTARPTDAAQAALARLLAWRLDLAHIDPISTLTFTSTGNPRFPAGAPVFLRAISGHRDTGFTSCPGGWLYARIGAIAQTVAKTGLPKLFTPKVVGRIGKTVRFTARLSGPLAWSVVVDDATRTPVGLGSGTGTKIDWTWDTSKVLPGVYSYEISAGPGLRPVLGKLGGTPPPLRLTGVTAIPATITPNGDGIDDFATISYTLSTPATLTATLLDAAGLTVSRLFSDFKPAGSQVFTFSADTIPDGLYRIALVATDSRGTRVSASVAILVTRTPAELPRGPH